MHYLVVKIDAPANEGLSHDVDGGVLEVLGGESDAVNSLEARVSLFDDMAFNQSHRPLPSLQADRL
jgi:hypothetical protein